MKLDWSHWGLGLIAAVVTGAAGAVLTALASIGITPDAYNFGSGLHNILKLMGAAALINGIIGMAAYLKQSPVPPPEQNTKTT
jgi:hypothetical protein